MRVAIAIPHFFKPDGEGQHGSVRDDAAARAQALTRCLTTLHANLGTRQFGFYYSDHMEFQMANQPAHLDLHIFVCTRGGDHVLAQLAENPELRTLFTPVSVACEHPKLLGFECHKVLAERLGDYDYYCYLEDDLIIHDPYFFRKLQWFTSQMGDRCLLQPNRFEIMESPMGQKAYIDAAFETVMDPSQGYAQDFTENRTLNGVFLGQPIQFERAGNPHSGCFFLNRAQMEYWVEQPFFGTPETWFIGPLESAASLDMIKAFRVYKPSPTNANFLEIQHDGQWQSQFLMENHAQLMLISRVPETDGV